MYGNQLINESSGCDQTHHALPNYFTYHLGNEKMIITGPIDNFFKNPSLPPSPEGDGVLFHLRRDLEKLYGAEGAYTTDPSPHAMLSMMGILAGMDYLSKVYSLHKSSRKRFVETMSDLCNITNNDSEAVYQARCALVHSVALSTISHCNYKKGVKFNFEVTDDDRHPLIEKLSDANCEVAYRISFWELKKIFLKVIEKLESIARDIGHPKNRHVINMIGQLHSEKILKK